MAAMRGVTLLLVGLAALGCSPESDGDSTDLDSQGRPVGPIHSHAETICTQLATCEDIDVYVTHTTCVDAFVSTYWGDTRCSECLSTLDCTGFEQAVNDFTDDPCVRVGLCTADHAGEPGTPAEGIGEAVCTTLEECGFVLTTTFEQCAQRFNEAAASESDPCHECMVSLTCEGVQRLLDEDPGWPCAVYCDG